jgi:hypothetical protein
MPSARDCADRLREQAYKTLLPQIQDLQEGLQQVSGLLSTGVRQIETKLDALRHTELPATELVLNELLEEDLRKRDLEGKTLSLFMYELRTKETQEEILTLLLDSATHYFPKVALFVARGDRFSGWSSRGFDETAARSLCSDSFLQSDCAKLQEALKGDAQASISELTGSESLRFMQEEAQGSWQLFPLHILQRPVALLIAGESNSVAGRPEALSVLMECVSLRLENISLKILNALGAAKPQTIYQAAPAVGSVAPEPVVQTAISSKAEPAAGQLSEPSVEALQELEEEPSLETPVASTDITEQTSALSASEAIFTTPIIALGSSPAPQAADIQEEEKLHSAAKRFARLLVSEIKLYNENAVVEGRKNRDLYSRLKKDIDRSREMYEKRVAPIVACKIDYFHDEIVRILGDNDVSTLGSDYPRIESESGIQ